MPAGRKRKHDRAQVMRAVCEAISKGALVNAAAKAQGVASSCIREWALEDEFAALYARARDSQAHAIAEQAIALADKAIPGKDGNTDKVRIQVDTRKWLASKIAPRHYGERQEIVGNKDAPFTVRIIRDDA